MLCKSKEMDLFVHFSVKQAKNRPKFVRGLVKLVIDNRGSLEYDKEGGVKRVLSYVRKVTVTYSGG